MAAIFSSLAAVPGVTREGLLEKFKDETDKALAERWISQTVYDATTATDVTGKTNGSKGERASLLPSNSGEVQERGRPIGSRYALSRKPSTQGQAYTLKGETRTKATQRLGKKWFWPVLLIGWTTLRQK